MYNTQNVQYTNIQYKYTNVQYKYKLEIQSTKYNAD